jgi:hypothetical protein
MRACVSWHVHARAFARRAAHRRRRPRCPGGGGAATAPPPPVRIRRRTRTARRAVGGRPRRAAARRSPGGGPGRRACGRPAAGRAAVTAAAVGRGDTLKAQGGHRVSVPREFAATAAAVSRSGARGRSAGGRESWNCLEGGWPGYARAEPDGCRDCGREGAKGQAGVILLHRCHQRRRHCPTTILSVLRFYLFYDSIGHSSTILYCDTVPSDKLFSRR